jgi:hypothetical protein
VTSRIPRVIDLVGVLAVLATVCLSARLVWEQTALTVSSGPQMVGFSLAHSGAGFFLLAAPFFAAIWALITFALIAFRKESFRNLTVLLLTVYISSVLVLFVPYGFWQRLCVKTLANGPHAGEFVSYAAATGDLKTVEAFVSHGVSPEVRNESNDATPLHGAAVEGQLEVIEYLVSRGASVNALNAYGDSPMENARSMNRAEAMRLLQSHGGQIVRGTDEQSDMAIKAQVRRDIERAEE